MDIQEFVTESLRQVVQGVSAARSENQGIAPNTIMLHGHKVPTSPLIGDFGNEVIYFIDFDLAVSVSDKKDAGGKAGLTVAGFFNVGGNKSATSETTSANRIRFMVPVSYTRTA